MSGTKGMLHGEVCGVTRDLEKSPSLTQGSSTLMSAKGNLAKGTSSAKGGGKGKSKLSKAQKM
jgi:hypothetical protein